MRLAGRDLEFLELLAVVGLQAILIFEASNLLGTPGDEAVGLICLAGVLILGLIVVFWDHFPFVNHSVALTPRASPSRGH